MSVLNKWVWVLALIDASASGVSSAADHNHAMAGMPGMEAAQHVAAHTYHATGMVKKISGTRITIDHAPIAALHWPAMTMDFIVKDKAVRVRMRPGQALQFDFIRDPSGRLQILFAAPA